MFIKGGSFNSYLLECKCGVHRGVVLAHCFFLFFINDLPNALKSFSLGIVYFISPAHLERCSSWDVVQWSHPIPSVRHIASDLNWPLLTWSNWQNFRILTKFHNLNIEKGRSGPRDPRWLVRFLARTSVRSFGTPCQSWSWKFVCSS